MNTLPLAKTTLITVAILKGTRSLLNALSLCTLQHVVFLHFHC